MKTAFISALLVHWAVVGMAQQGAVTLANSSGTPIVAYGTNVAAARVALYGSLSTNLVNDFSLTQIGATVDTFAPGLFSGGTRNIGNAGDIVTLQVRAWTGGFATYEQALIARATDGITLYGTSPFWFQPVGGGIQPTAPIIGVGRFQGADITVIPEPSHFALLILGTGAFLAFARRKPKPSP